MKFWTAYLALGLAFIDRSFGAGDGAHHGGPADLIAPLVNVLLLAGFLVWKLREPLSDYFTKLAEDVAHTLERASLKSKEAEVMLAAQEKRMANLEHELREIQRLTENDVRTYEKNVARETEEKSFKLKADANSKIDAEKMAINDEMHAALLDEVIGQAKTTIRGNKDYQTKASARMLGEIRT